MTLTALEVQVLALFTAAYPRAVRTNAVREYVNSSGDAKMEIATLDAIRSLCRRKLVIGCLVDGVVDKVGPDDLAAWRFYATKRGCLEITRVGR